MFGASVQPRRPCAPGGLATKAAAGQIAGTMPPLSQPEWTISNGLTDYDTALADMEARAAAIHAGATGERLWVLGNPAPYTAGPSDAPAELSSEGSLVGEECGSAVRDRGES